MDMKYQLRAAGPVVVWANPGVARSASRLKSHTPPPCRRAPSMGSWADGATILPFDEGDPSPPLCVSSTPGCYSASLASGKGKLRRATGADAGATPARQSNAADAVPGVGLGVSASGFRAGASGWGVGAPTVLASLNLRASASLSAM
eukprot:scaffold122344_cov27-Tisochrysis_lutea.AAC.3